MSGFSINQITLSGNLTRDPELRDLPSGVAVCNLRIANNTSRKDSSTGEYVDKPNYFDVTVWKGMGEWIARNVSKGDTVVVSGRIEWREWSDKDGNKRQSYDVVADSVVPVGGKGDSNGGGATLDDAREAVAAEAVAPKQTAGMPSGKTPASPENLKAYCVCPDGFKSDDCPIEGHGVPF